MKVLPRVLKSGFVQAILSACLAVLLTGSLNASANIGDLNSSNVNVRELEVCDVAPQLNSAEKRYHNLSFDEVEKLITIYEKECQLARSLAAGSLAQDVFDLKREELYREQVKAVAGKGAGYFVEVRAAFIEMIVQAERSLLELDAAARLYDVQSGISWLRQFALSERCAAEVLTAKSVMLSAVDALINAPDLLERERQMFEEVFDNFIADYRRTGGLNANLMDAMIGHADALEFVAKRMGELYEAVTKNHSLIDTYAIGSACPMIYDGVGLSLIAAD